MAGLLDLVQYAASDDDAQESDIDEDDHITVDEGTRNAPDASRAGDRAAEDEHDGVAMVLQGPPGPPAPLGANGTDAVDAAAPAGDVPVELSEEEVELQRLTAALPPEIINPPAEQCPAEWQERVRVLLDKQQLTGRLVSAEIRRNRDYRNPYFLEKMVEYWGVDPMGTAFPPEVFDPTALPKSDKSVELINEFKAWSAKRREEREKSGRIDFHKSGSQSMLQTVPGLSRTAVAPVKGPAPSTSGALQEAQKKAQQIASSLAARR